MFKCPESCPSPQRRDSESFADKERAMAGTRRRNFPVPPTGCGARVSSSKPLKEPAHREGAEPPPARNGSGAGVRGLLKAWPTLRREGGMCVSTSPPPGITGRPPTSRNFRTRPLHPRPNGWTHNPPIHARRIPSSKDEHVRAPGSTNRQTPSALMPPRPHPHRLTPPPPPSPARTLSRRYPLAGLGRVHTAGKGSVRAVHQRP